MLKALLIGNRASGSARRLSRVEVPGRWMLEPAAVTVEDMMEADLVALFGGDGTLQRTLTQVLRQAPDVALPPIAILPFGSTNMNALDLNVSRGRKATVASLLAAIEHERFDLVERSLLKVTDGGQDEYGFFFGMGVIADVIEPWTRQDKPHPVANHLRTAWAMLTGLSAITAAHPLALDGVPRSVYGLLATTLDRLLFGARPYWGEATPDSMRLTWVEASARHLLRRAPALLRGRGHLAAEPGYESTASRRVSLGFQGPYVVDGEVFHAGASELLIEPSAPLRWVRL